ncbi:hypothetical protein K3495_g12187 [Podosphaera aphanis]|nr:hypothetical protein K3495_g12187 [Podosphaera aphanis]
MKYMDESSSYDTKGYQAPIPMMRGAQQEAPKFARFSVVKNGGNKSGVSEDALPAMPSWDTASKKHILADDEEDKPANPTTSNAQNIPLVSAAAATGMSSPSIQGRPDPAPFPPRPAQTPVNGYYNSAPAAPPRGYTVPPSPQVQYMANGPGYRGPTAQLPSHSPFTPMSPRFPPERMGSPASGIRGYQASPERMGSPASSIRGYQAPPERQMYPSPSSTPNHQNADYQQFNQPRGPSRGPVPYRGYGAY